MHTPQESFWQGQFGNDYTSRNAGDRLIASNTALFRKILAARGDGPVGSILELGANRGNNLLALAQLLPSAQLAAVEINEQAVAALKTAVPQADVYHTSILDFSPEAATWDLVLTKGVLIHINPDRLPEVYTLMHRLAHRYIVVAEYYNPSPVEVPYRGHAGKLFKRDFAGELLDRFPDLRLVDYGFVYHRDRHAPLDDVTWFLLEKSR